MRLTHALDTLNARQRKGADMKHTKFFYKHAGYSYDPKRETGQAGRWRCARMLAEAEAWARNAGVYFEWGLDGNDSSEWSDEKPYRPTYECVAILNGKCVGALCGIDDNTMPYRRVVEAEIACEAMPKGGRK